MSNDAVYVYSTLSQSVGFAFYASKTDPSQLHEIEEVIYIKGGTGVITKMLVTPRGLVTKITAQQYKWLIHGRTEKEGPHPTFKHYLDNGHITVEIFKESANKVAKNMKAKDGSAQLTKDDAIKKGFKPMD